MGWKLWNRPRILNHLRNTAAGDPIKYQSDAICFSTQTRAFETSQILNILLHSGNKSVFLLVVTMLLLGTDKTRQTGEQFRLQMAHNTYSDMEITFSWAPVLLVEQTPIRDSWWKKNSQWQWLRFLSTYLYLDQDNEVCADDNSKLMTNDSYILSIESNTKLRYDLPRVTQKKHC